MNNNDNKELANKTLQVSIVKRFMTDEEWAEFQKEYWSNRHAQQFRDRGRSLGIEITDEEREMLGTFIEDTSISNAKLNEMFPGKNVAYTSGRIALRFLYQNQELLKRI